MTRTIMLEHDADWRRRMDVENDGEYVWLHDMPDGDRVVSIPIPAHRAQALCAAIMAAAGERG